jgi:hypothetical protein
MWLEMIFLAHIFKSSAVRLLRRADPGSDAGFAPDSASGLFGAITETRGRARDGRGETALGLIF